MLAAMRAIHIFRVVGLAAVLLIALVWIGVRNYGGNVSALLHMDVPFGELHMVPESVVLYEDAAYDGMLYYQVARDIPELVFGDYISLDSPYRFQRILLPLLMNAVTLGDERGFPLALLLLNLVAALLTLWIMVGVTRKAGLHAWSSLLNPAMLIGILYSLTEPVSALFIAVFLGVWERAGKQMTAWGILALTLSMFARETTIFLLGLLFAWYVFKREWRNAAAAVIPAIPFFVWQHVLSLRFGDIGFQANSNIIDFPFKGPVQAFLWLLESHGPMSYRLSSLALLAFLLPLCAVLAREWITKKGRVDIYTFLMSGLCATMLCMDAHMWGAITSIGRVVTPLYPVYALYAARHDSKVLRWISAALILVSVVAAVGIAMVPHPFRVSSSAVHYIS